jgi:hypothetical protein
MAAALNRCETVVVLVRYPSRIGPGSGSIPGCLATLIDRGN